MGFGWGDVWKYNPVTAFPVLAYQAGKGLYNEVKDGKSAGQIWGKVSGSEAARAAADKQENAALAAIEAQTEEAQRARDFFEQQAGKGVQAINQGTWGAGMSLNQASGNIDQAAGMAEGALQGSGADALSSLGAGYGQARGDLQGVRGPGPGAYDALSQRQDRLGAAAGRDPFANFQQDPGYQFRQQQGEQAINRSAAARGGRLGGDTLKELAQFNQGLASQEYQNFANRQLAAKGQELGALGQSDASYNALLANQAGRADQAALTSRAQDIGIASQLAGLGAQQGQATAGLQQDIGSRLAGLYQNTGAQQASVNTNMANLLSGAGNNIANTYMGTGANNTALSQGLMGAMGGAVPYAGGGLMAQANNQQQLLGLGIAALGALSDRRLKSDITPLTGSRYERIGLRGYGWKWNDKANRMGLKGSAQGVIAQEVQEIYPEAVEKHAGYLAVRYDLLEEKLREVAA